MAKAAKQHPQIPRLPASMPMTLNNINPPHHPRKTTESAKGEAAIVNDVLDPSLALKAESVHAGAAVEAEIAADHDQLREESATEMIEAGVDVLGPDHVSGIAAAVDQKIVDGALVLAQEIATAVVGIERHPAVHLDPAAGHDLGHVGLIMWLHRPCWAHWPLQCFPCQAAFK